MTSRMFFLFSFHKGEKIQYLQQIYSNVVVLCRLRRVLSAESGITILLAHVITPNTDLPHIIMIIIIIFYIYLSLTYLVKNFLKFKFESQHLVFVNFTSVNLSWAQCTCYWSNLISG